MPSSVILNAGITGNGKNFRCRKIVNDPIYKDWDKFTVDPAGEFANESWYQLDPTSDITAQVNRIRNAIITLDEPQIYMPPANTKEAKIWEIILSQCRHRHILVIFNYHTLRRVPAYICDYINLIILGHTNDQFSEAKKFGARENAIRSAMDQLATTHKNDDWKAIPIK